MSQRGVDPEELGRKLGEAIAESPAHRDLERAEERVENDPEAQARIEAFERARSAFVEARERGEATQADLRAVEEAQAELHDLAVMADYLDAKERVQEQLEAVNEAISGEIALDFGGAAGGCCHD